MQGDRRSTHGAPDLLRPAAVAPAREAAGEQADPEVVAEARRRKEAALLDFGVGHSVVASWLYAKCHRHLATTALPTAAVTATGDGRCALLYNPYFFASLDFDGVKFVLFHEARHLMRRHLYVDEELRSDPVFTLAAEVAINHVALRRLGRSALPEAVPAGGGEPEPVGVDPDAVDGSYREDLRRQGLAPLPYDDFVRTDLTVYGELRRMRSRETPRSAFCVHLAEDAQEGDVPLDPETVAQVGDDVCAR